MHLTTRLRTISLFCLAAGFCCVASAAVSSAIINATNTAIDSLRKRDCAITVTGSNGSPLSGATVSVKQVRRHFGFGAALPFRIISDTMLQKVFLQNFEWAVFENDLKWPSTDPTPDGPDYSRPDSMLDWCRKNDIKVRAHCLFWNQDTGKIPEWTRNLNTTAFNAAVDARITNAVTHYKGKVEQWDVANEVIHGTVFETKTGNQNIWNSIFTKVRAIDGTAQLAINDFNIVERYSDVDKYITKINTIRAAAPLNLIGLEGHFGGDLVQSDYKTKLEKVAAVGLPIWFTEVDFSVAMNVRCDRFEELIRTAFANPKVEGFTMWTFWQGNLWRDNLTSYFADSATYATNDLGQRYQSLMTLWKTNANGTTDASGKYSFRGFQGKYVVTTTVSGASQVDTVYVEPGKTVKAVSITIRNTGTFANNGAASGSRSLRINGIPFAFGQIPTTAEPLLVSIYSTSGKLLCRQTLRHGVHDLNLPIPPGCYLVGIGRRAESLGASRIVLR